MHGPTVDQQGEHSELAGGNIGGCPLKVEQLTPYDSKYHEA